LGFVWWIGRAHHQRGGAAGIMYARGEALSLSSLLFGVPRPALPILLHPSSTHSPACFAFRPPSSSTPRIHSHLTFRDDQGLGQGGGGGGCVGGSGGGSGGQVE